MPLLSEQLKQKDKTSLLSERLGIAVKPKPSVKPTQSFEVGGMSTPQGEVGGMTLDPSQISSGGFSLQSTPVKQIKFKQPSVQKVDASGRAINTLPEHLTAV